MYQKGLCSYYVTTSHPPTSFKRYCKNTVKMSYCCTQNVARIIKSHNKKLVNMYIKNTLPCNSTKKHKRFLNGKCRAENNVYKYIVSVYRYPNKVYLSTAEGDLKQRFYNHRILFNSEGLSTDKTLSKYVWEMKKKFKIMLSLKWSIIKSLQAY